MKNTTDHKDTLYNRLPIFRIVMAFAAGIVILLSTTAALRADDEQDHQRYREPEMLAELIEKNQPLHLLIDVRTRGEYSQGHIPTAVNIPVQAISENPPEVPKDQLVIVYCRSGGRSAQAAQILRDLGYTRVVDFGGIYRWEGALE